MHFYENHLKGSDIEGKRRENRVDTLKLPHDTLRKTLKKTLFGIFSISAISGSLFIRWAYQQYILALEVKNSAKVTFLGFNTTAIFLHDVMVSDNDVLEVG